MNVFKGDFKSVALRRLIVKCIKEPGHRKSKIRLCAVIIETKSQIGINSILQI